VTWLLSPWTWAVLGLVLAGLEAFAPGVFLLWIGLAAFACALLLVATPLSLEWLLIAFCGFTLVSVLLGRRIYGTRETGGDAPFLNRRAEALVGRETLLQSAIENGVGLARIDDTVWRVCGDEMPAGARVRIVAVARDGTMLRVEPA
jgi:membrane protein implicated in regulation of membrane protease activity